MSADVVKGKILYMVDDRKLRSNFVKFIELGIFESVLP